LWILFINKADIRLSVKIIGVIGGSSCSKEDYEVAREVGRLIARAGALLVCGGKSGVMEAACRGAWEEKGLTIGILPGNDLSEANQYISAPVATGMGIGRNIIIVHTAQALIAVDGKFGTLSEISYALQLGKPIFCLNSWPDIPGIRVVENASEAVDMALQSIG
jgi:uncharacterized protein (TIGR00725 family)